MFYLDVLGNPEPLSIYLVKVDGSVLGSLDNIIDESSASLQVSLNKQYELDIDLMKPMDNGLQTNAVQFPENWYEFVHEGMYLFVEKVGLFKMNQPEITNDGSKETKRIKAYSVDSELEDKMVILSINMGLKTSMEYLVTYDEDETEELLNPYTGVPYDWIVIYNMFPEQLAPFKSKIDRGYYGSPDEHGDITVTDINKIEEITELINLIPRLKSKATYTDNPDGSTDTAITDYIIPQYNTISGELESYILDSGLSDRVAYLITFYTKYRDQLSLLSIILESTGGVWTIGDLYGVSSGDYSLVNKRYQFDIEETVYSFLTQTFAETAKCIVHFDLLNRKVNMTPVENIGSDTGIVMAYDTLVNSLSISTEEDRLATRLRVTGGDDMEITRVNFGSSMVEDLSYKMNAKDQNGQRIYVSDALARKYDNFRTYRESQREDYITLSKEYEELATQINAIKNRLPNDGLQNDWGTFSLEELQAALTSFKNLLATLKSLYKEEYGNLGLNPDGSINDDYMATTSYYWDYVAYQEIITQIECAISVFPNYDDHTYWTVAQKNEYEDAIKAWETDWTLFGTEELQAKISTYKQNMDLMLEEQKGVGSGESKSAVIRKNDSGYEIKQWSELTDEEKESYGDNSDAYHYSLYMSYYNNADSAQEYLDGLLEEVADLEESQAQTQSDRNDIVQTVQFESYFTADECKVIYALLRDSEYQNENILTTSIDTSSEKIDHMYELLQDAQNKVTETSRPQLAFSIESDNLLGLTEFAPLWKQFYPGNYLMVQYHDDVYVKLRLLGFSFNPCLPTENNMQIEFSNFTRTKSYYNDWDSLLGSGGGTGSSGGSSGSGGSGGTYGESDDIDITISNTMLAKLLNTETFGTRVTDIILDTIDVNKLFARMATFGGLAKGTTTIDGKCIITGYIHDQFYNGTNGGINNTEGSIINLESGKFSYAGGKILYDGSELKIIVDKLYIGSSQMDIAQEIDTIEDELGNIYELSIQTSYSANTITYTASLIQNGIDVSAESKYSSDFEWYIKKKDELQYIGFSRTITVLKQDVTYGQAVLVTWTERDNFELTEYGSDNYLVDSGTNHLIGRSQCGMRMRAETSLFDDESLHQDMSNLQITAEEIKSSVSDIYGNMSVISQHADNIEARVINDEGDIGSLELRADEFNIQITANKNNIETLQGQMATAFDELGNIYELSVNTSYSSTQVTYTAKLLQNGSDISDQAEYKYDFVWYAKNKDNLEYLGYGRTLDVDIDSLSYGQAIMLVWTQREFTFLLDNNGNNLLDGSGNKLYGRAENDNGLVMMVETSIFDDKSLGADMSEFRLTATELTSRITDTEGNMSILQQTAKGFQSTVTGDASSTGTIAYDKDGNVYRLTTDMYYTSTDIVYTATLLKNGENLSDRVDITNDFAWYSKTRDEFEYLGYGRTLTIPLTETNFGIAVACEWTEREYAHALDNQGNTIMLNNGTSLYIRTETDYII